MSGGFLGRITRRIGRALVSIGLGSPNGGAPPAPVIITGPCFAAQLGDPAIAGVTGDAQISAAMATDPAISLAFGDPAIAGIVGDAQIEGMAIDVC